MKKIKGKYYVHSKTSGKDYVLDKDLRCQTSKGGFCQGFEQWGHCKHQKETIKDLEKGEAHFVEMPSLTERERPANVDIYGRFTP